MAKYLLYISLIMQFSTYSWAEVCKYCQLSQSVVLRGVGSAVTFTLNGEGAISPDIDLTVSQNNSPYRPETIISHETLVYLTNPKDVENGMTTPGAKRLVSSLDEPKEPICRPTVRMFFETSNGNWGVVGPSSITYGGRTRTSGKKGRLVMEKYCGKPLTYTVTPVYYFTNSLNNSTPK